MRDFCRLTLILAAMLLALVCGACGAPNEDAASPNLLGAAAAEATAIVAQAQATAMVLQARAQATAVVAQADILSHSPTPAPTLAVALGTGDQRETGATLYPEDGPEPTPLQTVEVTGVGFAGEGGLIMVRFRAPPEVAEQWWQGSVAVTDEVSGVVYNEIPVMPKIGPLIGRPKVDGQIGYVMLVNPPPYLKRGAVVTVKLGNYTFEHVQVQ